MPEMTGIHSPCLEQRESSEGKGPESLRKVVAVELRSHHRIDRNDDQEDEEGVEKRIQCGRDCRHYTLQCSAQSVKGGFWDIHMREIAHKVSCSAAEHLQGLEPREDSYNFENTQRTNN